MTRRPREPRRVRLPTYAASELEIRKPEPPIALDEDPWSPLLAAFDGFGLVVPADRDTLSTLAAACGYVSNDLEEQVRHGEAGSREEAAALRAASRGFGTASVNLYCILRSRDGAR